MQRLLSKSGCDEGSTGAQGVSTASQALYPPQQAQQQQQQQQDQQQTEMDVVDELMPPPEAASGLMSARQAAELASLRTVRIETAGGASFVVMPEGSASTFERLARERGLDWMQGACIGAPMQAVMTRTPLPAATPRATPMKKAAAHSHFADSFGGGGGGGGSGVAGAGVLRGMKGGTSSSYTQNPNGEATSTILPPTRAVMGLYKARILSSWEEVSVRDGDVACAAFYRELLGKFVDGYEQRKTRVF